LLLLDPLAGVDVLLLDPPLAGLDVLLLDPPLADADVLLLDPPPDDPWLEAVPAASADVAVTHARGSVASGTSARVAKRQRRPDERPL
jgi:hypothetical protein